MKKVTRQKIRMKLNTLALIERTGIIIELDKPDYKYNLQMLASFRPGASLRQINNQRKANF